MKITCLALTVAVATAQYPYVVGQSPYGGLVGAPRVGAYGQRAYRAPVRAAAPRRARPQKKKLEQTYLSSQELMMPMLFGLGLVDQDDGEDHMKHLLTSGGMSAASTNVFLPLLIGDSLDGPGWLGPSTTASMQEKINARNDAIQTAHFAQMGLGGYGGMGSYIPYILGQTNANDSPESDAMVMMALSGYGAMNGAISGDIMTPMVMGYGGRGGTGPMNSQDNLILSMMMTGGIGGGTGYGGPLGSSMMMPLMMGGSGGNQDLLLISALSGGASGFGL